MHTTELRLDTKCLVAKIRDISRPSIISLVLPPIQPRQERYTKPTETTAEEECGVWARSLYAHLQCRML